MIPPGLIESLREQYLIVRETGRGASATVYLARDLKHDRLVALKTLDSGIGSRAGERFLREIQVAAGMQHPHILPMYDSGIADGRLYFVMPFVDGGSLRQRLDAEPQLPLGDALHIAHEIAIALAFAHDQGIVHRDIKPDNILFYHDHACLADFGVARVMEQIDVRLTGHGMIVGTPAYMSPEQLSDGGFDGRSDVYSLACVLYEMIGGVHAFAGSTPQELLRKRLRQTPEPLSKLRADVPIVIDELLARALATSPEARFPDARAFADAIDDALHELATHTPRRRRRAFDRLPGHPLAWAGSVAMILALASLGAAPLRSILRDRAGNTLEAATRSARDSYRLGKAAFDKWDLSTAERELERAASGDARLVSAQLLLAQTLELERRLDSDQFRLATARIAASQAALHGRDSLYASALIALGERSYPRACDSFNRLRAADSLDALAWYGLGDCLALDSTIVRDGNSPSGWSFRTSWSAAAQAYMRAATVDPSAHRALSYSMIANLVPTTPLQIRTGRTTDAAPRAFAANPSLISDTVAYVPVPLADFTAAKAGSVPATLPDALHRNRDILLAFARQWVASNPQNPDAFEALAAAHEARGELGSDSDGAGGAIRRARSLATLPDQQLKLANVDVRLRLKRGELESTRALADSLLAAWADKTPSPTTAARLSGIAALTGRLDRAGELRAIAWSEQNAGLGIAPPLTSIASRLFVRAAAGLCDDSLLAMRREVDRMMESYSQPARVDAVRRELLVRPMSLAFPCLGPHALDGLPAISALDIAQHAAAAQDARRVRAVLDSLDAVRSVLLPGEVALDFTVQEAWLRTSIGDTAVAIRQLDRVLNALPTLGQWATREDAQAAAVGRALVLRAELAASMGEIAERQRRAQEALVLWQHADASFKPTLDRLRALATPTR